MVPGPAALGRSVIVLPGGPVPGPWATAPRILVDEATLRSPGPALDLLHEAWAARRPVVIELACDQQALRVPERVDGPVHALDPSFELPLERLHFLVWANSYDARTTEPVWWHGRKAAARIAGVREGGPADVVGPDGRPCFVDGGPPDPPELPTGIPVAHRWGVEEGSIAPAGHRPPSADLAPDQMAAVTHGAGGARVIAPAGSGKTRVLTERLRHLVVDRAVHPRTVTAVAYNRAAAAEMRARCADVVGPAGGATVRTLNGLGLWICQAYGGDGRLELVEDVRRLVEEIFPVPRVANTDSVAPYVEALSRVRLGLEHPEDVEAADGDVAGLADGFEAYRAALAARRQLDFDEQVYRAVEILVRDPGARADARRYCRRLLVDELQDLHPAHLLLLRVLCAPGYDCFGVGDDDQVIYGYSGASPRFLVHFDRYFPGSGRHALEVNYRCPPGVVDAARHLLSYNRERVEKEIRTPAARGGPPPLPSGPLAGAGSVAVVRVPGEEMAGRCVEVLRSWREAGVPDAGMAVLARVNAALLPVQVACVHAGIPVTPVLTPAVLRRTGIRTALAYLRIGCRPDRIDAADLRDTVHRPARRIARNVVEMLTRRPQTSIADIRRLSTRLSGSDVAKLREYADDLGAVAAACARSTAAALRAVRLDVGLGESVDVLDASRGDADRATHADDLLAVESVAALHPDPTTFEQWLGETLARPRAPGPAVQLSTVHRIKGREWARVVVFGATRGLFPHRLGDDVEGERRVFHVALTRATTQVAVLVDSEAPSRFVAELDGSAQRTARTTRSTPAARADRADQTRRSDRAPSGPASRSPTGAAPDRVEAALREWRSATARSGGVPAYVVLNDRDLLGIAASRPSSLAALARCRGVGSVRLERYGDEILAVIERAGAAPS